MRIGLIFLAFTLILSSLCSAGPAEDDPFYTKDFSIKKDEPLSAFGLTLGETRAEVEALFTARDMKPVYRSRFYTRYEHPLEKALCGAIQLAFYRDKLVEMICFNAVFMENESAAKECLLRHMELFKQVRHRYGDAGLHEDNSLASKKAPLIIRDTWTIDNKYYIWMSFEPDSSGTMYLSRIGYAELTGASDMYEARDKAGADNNEPPQADGE